MINNKISLILADETMRVFGTKVRIKVPYFRIKGHRTLVFGLDKTKCSHILQDKCKLDRDDKVKLREYLEYNFNELSFSAMTTFVHALSSYHNGCFNSFDLMTHLKKETKKSNILSIFLD